ncbi:MAG: dihydroorotase [Nannocystaceae bacterium]
MQELTILQPDDWHLHLRDGDTLPGTVAHAARRFGRALIMPNLQPAVTTVEDALSYRSRIMAARPAGSDFEPLMSLYLTDHTSPAEVQRAADNPHIIAIKLYPAGATTHSEYGVTGLSGLAATFEAMEALGLPLLVHGESTEPGVDVFDREARFVQRELTWIVERFPALRVVLEHVTTAEGVDFVRQGGATIAATITAHHLLLNRNAMFDGGLLPHAYCLPVLKRERHREALLEAATSGHARFFLGTDSAPHPRARKESACGCAGIYTAHASIELYAQVFEQASALGQLEAFASLHGPRFYGREPNARQLVLQRREWEVPPTYRLGTTDTVPLFAGQTVAWQLASDYAARGR